jgi:hypothetical protein
MAPSSQSSWGLSTTSTSSSQAQKPPLIQSPNPWSQPSQLSDTKDPRSDTIGWGVNLLEDGSSTPKTAVPSPAVMTKEEKALEMIKRKEERKQVCFKTKASRRKGFIIFVSANCDVEGAEEGRNKDMTSAIVSASFLASYHPINVISNVQISVWGIPSKL